MNIRTPGSYERKADRCEDLASALDAGLTFRDVLGSTADASVVPALSSAGIWLDSIDERVLEAAERAGELPAALRDRARAWRSLAQLQRDVASRLAYPMFLLVAATVLSIVLGFVGMGVTLPAIALGGVCVVFAGIAWWIRRAHRQAELPPMPGPLRRLLFDYSTLPYLSAVHGLFRAGIPILEAHELAVRVAPIGDHRARLLRSALQLDRDRIPLTEALAHHSAADPETLQILTTAERSGDLEDGLDRALQRRRHHFELGIKRLARLVGGSTYAFVVFIVAYFVISFYSNLYSRSF